MKDQFILIFSIIISIQLFGQEMGMKEILNTVEAPIAKRSDYRMVKHGDSRVDPYFWMRLSDDQKNAEDPDQHTQSVLDYLNAENKYTDKVTSHLKPLQEKLYDEIVGRIKKDDNSVPYLYNGYYYYSRYELGKEYPIYGRKKDNLDNPEEVILDVNVLAKDFEYYQIGDWEITLNNSILAYSEDVVSRRIYTIKFKNLETGELYPDEIPNTAGGITWGNDNKTVFYTIRDEALRPYKVMRHILGTPTSEDVVVYHEKDALYRTYIYKSKSEKYLIIGSSATLADEYRILDAYTPQEEFTLFHPRERKLEYNISHYKDHWYILTNKDEATNFKLMKTALDKTGVEHWQEFIEHRPDVLLNDVEIFKDHFVLGERVNGLTELRVKSWDGSSDYYIEFDDAVYDVGTSTNPNFDTHVLRFYFTSLKTPSSSFDFNMNDKSRQLLKQQEVVGGYVKDDFITERIMSKSRDGVEVPISIVYKKGTKKDGSAPLLLYAYGSYGYSIDPSFSSVRLSLLDRGFIYAIAHIRGGQEMGRMWYENGKFLHKKNTFFDFIDCGKTLINQQYTSSDNLFCYGGSAGGLLIGAVINESPELWKGAVAAVPFVDVVSTMLDETIPLTVGEYDEWGNPNDKTYYDYIKSYSPYDNIKEQDYPSLLITTGYHDSQVQYWEPAKWIAKLRHMKTNNNPMLLHTEMGAGHGGKSGRFKRYRETALTYSFLLDLADIKE